MIRRRHRSTLLRFVAATFGTNVGVAVVSFVNVLIVARFLGPTGRGEFAFLVAMANLTHYVSTLGLQEANINFAGRHPELRRSLATNSVLAALLFGLTAALAVEGIVVLAPAVGGHSSSLWRAVALASVPVLILQTYMRRLIQADSGFTVTNVGWLLGPVANVVGNGALALAGLLTVGSAIATWVAGQVLGTLLVVVFYAVRLVGYGRPDRRLARSTLAFGIKSHAGAVMMVGNYRLDQWILGATRSASELGIYSVAVAFAETLFYLPEAVRTVVRPRLVRADRVRAALETGVYFRITMLLTGTLAAVVVLLAPYLVQGFFGEEFAAAAPQLRVLAAGAFGIVALKVLGAALTAQRRPELESAAAGVAFVATIALNAWLIPSYGGMGASIASTLSYLVGGVAVAVLFLRAMRTPASSIRPHMSDLRVLVESARGAPEGREAALPERG